MGEQQRERQHAEDRPPDHEFASETIAQGAADESARGGRAKEDKQIDLRNLHRDLKRLDEIERVIARQAREVEHLRKDEHDQERDRARHHFARQGGRRGRRAAPFGAGAPRRIPLADPRQKSRSPAARAREPDDRPLAERHDDERGHQGSERLAEIAADLKQGLRKAMTSARRRAGHPRRFRMKDRRPHADHRDRDQKHGVAMAEGEQGQAEKGEQHRERQRIRLRADDRCRARSRAAAARRSIGT